MQTILLIRPHIRRGRSQLYLFVEQAIFPFRGNSLDEETAAVVGRELSRGHRLLSHAGDQFPFRIIPEKGEIVPNSHSVRNGLDVLPFHHG